MKVSGVPDVLIKIIRRYDLLLIQEIRDASGEGTYSVILQPKLFQMQSNEF